MSERESRFNHSGRRAITHLPRNDHRGLTRCTLGDCLDYTTFRPRTEPSRGKQAVPGVLGYSIAACPRFVLLTMSLPMASMITHPRLSFVLLSTFEELIW
jgi:hypothetical protein